MLSLASVSEFPTFTNYKIRITLLIFLKCRDEIHLIGCKYTDFISDIKCFDERNLGDEIELNKMNKPWESLNNYHWFALFYQLGHFSTPKNKKNKGRQSSDCQPLSVPRPGLEPGWIAPLVFETSASTDSAIWALCRI